MSYESAADFYNFITDLGREGSYSSSQGSMLHPRGEPQGQGSRPGSHSHSSCLVLGLTMDAVVSSGPHVVHNPRNVKTIRCHDYSPFFLFFYSKSQMLTLFPFNHDMFSLSYLILSYLSFLLSYLLKGHTIKIVNSALFGRAVYSSGLSHRSRRGPVGVRTPSVEMSLEVRNSQFLPTASTASNSSLVNT